MNTDSKGDQNKSLNIANTLLCCLKQFNVSKPFCVNIEYILFIRLLTFVAQFSFPE